MGMPDIYGSVLAAGRGSREAYEALVGQYHGWALAFARRKLGHEEKARDAAQEAFIEGWLGIGRLRDPRAFPYWFRRILIKHCDRLSRTREPKAGQAPARTGPPPVEAVLREECRRGVLQAVSRLPFRQRTVTSLYYLDGRSTREIAVALALPLTAVKKRLADARRTLRALLRAWWVPGQGTPLSLLF